MSQARVRPTRLAALLAAVALAGAGCGGSDDNESSPRFDIGEVADNADERAAAETVSAFNDAIERGDGRAACEQFATQVRSDFVEATIEAFGGEKRARRVFASLECSGLVLSVERSDAALTNIEVKGDRATLTLSDGSAEDLTKIAGEWKLSAR